MRNNTNTKISLLHHLISHTPHRPARINIPHMLRLLNQTSANTALGRGTAIYKHVLGARSPSNARSSSVFGCSVPLKLTVCVPRGVTNVRTWIRIPTTSNNSSLRNTSNYCKMRDDGPLLYRAHGFAEPLGELLLVNGRKVEAWPISNIDTRYRLQHNFVLTKTYKKATCNMPLFVAPKRAFACITARR